MSAAPAHPNGGDDPLVIRSTDLRAVVEPHIERQRHEFEDAMRAGEWGGYGWGRGGLDGNGRQGSPILSGLKWLAAASGLDPTRISKVLYRQSFVGLRVADLLLTACGEQHALWDGRVQVIEHPQMGAETVRRRLTRVGVDNPDDVLTVANNDNERRTNK